MTNTGYESGSLQINNEIGILHTTWKDNKFIDEQYLKVLLGFKGEDDYFYSVYALGEWTALKTSGRIYKKFSDANIVEWSYKDLMPLVVCVDFNVNPMKWAFIQKHNGVDYIFDELVKEDTYTEEMAKETLLKFGLRSYTFYGDYSGNFRSTKSNQTDYEIIKQIIPSAIIRTQPNPSIVDRVNTVNWRLCNDKEEQPDRRLFVDPKCTHVLKDFRRVTWKKDRHEEDQTNPELTHISSAIGYYINYEYSLKKTQATAHWA